MSSALSFPVPSTLGSIDNYIQAINRFPLLTEKQEKELAEQHRHDGDLDAAHKLVMSHLRLVVAISRGYIGYGLPHSDLIQEGNIGLMKAVKRFDPDRGVRLVSFAIHWIKAEIHEYILRNWRLVKVATTKAQRKLFFNLRSMKNDLNTLKPAEVAKIASTLKVKPEEVVEMETRLGGRDINLDGSDDGDGDDQFAPINYLPDPQANPAEQIETRQLSAMRSAGLDNAIANLDERSKDIICQRWLTEDGNTTLHKLADKYQISAERVRQIETKAMQKIRAELGALN